MNHKTFTFYLKHAIYILHMKQILKNQFVANKFSVWYLLIIVHPFYHVLFPVYDQGSFIIMVNLAPAAR